jgi:xanthosine utilization system XapX-like protein
MARQALTLVAVVTIFGVLLPWYKGLTLLQPLIVLAYALMALLFVAPAASEFWSAIEVPAPAGAVLFRMLVMVGYGFGIALAMLTAAIITLNLTYRSARLLIPPEPFLGATLLLSLTASAAVAVVCALLARRFSPATAKAIVRACFLLTLFGLAFGSRILPESWQIELTDHTTRRAITSLAWEGSIACTVITILGTIFILRSSPASPETVAS